MPWINFQQLLIGKRGREPPLALHNSYRSAVEGPAMGRNVVHMALTAGSVLMLAGCGIADSRSPVPEFMRAKAPEPPPLEAPPDIKMLLHEKLDSVFTAASHPTHVQVSPPRHDLRGPGWTACVKAEVTSVTGKPLGMQTYRIMIADGVILDRQRIEGEDTCAIESYEPV